MTDAPQQTLGLTEFRRLAHKLGTERGEARRDMERYAQQEADAERDYRRELATAYAKARSAGETGNGAEIAARAEAADAKHKRDLAAAMYHSTKERIASIEATRAMLRAEAEWSQRIDGTVA